MIRVAIVEDEEAVREQLLGYVQRYTRQYGTTFEIRTFSDGVEILEGTARFTISSCWMWR